jgi:hypothetical protein
MSGVNCKNAHSIRLLADAVERDTRVLELQMLQSAEAINGIAEQLRRKYTGLEDVVVALRREADALTLARGGRP